MNGSTPPFRLEGECALITGGGSGLGLAIAQCMTAAGARVVLAGRQEARLATAAATIGNSATFVAHDVTRLDQADVVALAGAVAIDGDWQSLHAVAGCGRGRIPHGSIHITTPSVWHIAKIKPPSPRQRFPPYAEQANPPAMSPDTMSRSEPVPSRARSHRYRRRNAPLLVAAAGFVAVPIAGSCGEIDLAFSGTGAPLPAAIATSGQPAAPSEAAILMSVKDIKGSYSIPYIQSDRELRIAPRFDDVPGSASVLLQLSGPGGHFEKIVGKNSPTALFTELAPGEYRLAAEWRDEANGKLAERNYAKLGIGTVVCAMGDSITEGYHGRGFMMENLDLKASDFTPEVVSKDGRNFPQFSPTTRRHRPDVNTLESWMPRLNDLLSAAWRHPVFIANEGWGGIDTARYLKMLRTDLGWQQRMRQLRPSLWLIHLGVNDGRAKRSPEQFAANLEAIVDLLISDYAAEPSKIFIALPSYDYASGAEKILSAYRQEIQRLVEKRGLRQGPDFFAAYAKDRARYYGKDPVHPNETGVEMMADLWADALVANPSGKRDGESHAPRCPHAAQLGGGAGALRDG